MRTGKRIAAAACGGVLAALLAGCGTPGAPQPPSLNLPGRVTDLSAVRAGNRVSLAWTMPKRNTDKLPLKTNVTVRICRREGGGDCEAAGSLEFAPGSEGTFAENLPRDLGDGPPRSLQYFVVLTNRHGRSAGFSNAAAVLAGEAPLPVTGLTAEVRKSGVVLRWEPADADAAVRLRRKLLTPPPAKAQSGPLSAPPEPLEQTLLVEPEDNATLREALDKSIVFGNAYEYRAQRVVSETVDGRELELDGEVSGPIRVEALDVFPLAVPKGLAAVATAADPATGTAASIDLSWQPDTETDLAGYEVYRREDTTPWQRISGSGPVVGPAFRDAHVLPGHTYRYGVSAVDKGGHESARSEEASETVPSE